MKEINWVKELSSRDVNDCYEWFLKHYDKLVEKFVPYERINYRAGEKWLDFETSQIVKKNKRKRQKLIVSNRSLREERKVKYKQEKLKA